MTPILIVKNIAKSYGVRNILKNASFVLQDGEKVALVGANGVGKSTLLKIIAGNIPPDAGGLELHRGKRIGYNPQEIAFSDKESVGAYLEKALGAKAKDSKIEKRHPIFLKGFGIEHITQKTMLSKMSGGERSKLTLTALLLEDADILLLDEPTNNLDLPALIWLEEFLRESQKSAIIVSHDRRFLDALVTRVLEIDWFKRELTNFVGNHTDYLVHKAKELEKQKYEYLRQEEKKKQLLGAIQKKKEHVQRSIKHGMPDKDKQASGYHLNRATRNLSSQTKVLQVRIGRLNEAEKPLERAPLTIELVRVVTRAKPSIHLIKAESGYKGFRLGPITLEIPFGSRMGILGKNGSGKSTLLKMISGTQKLLKGERKAGPLLVFGNLTQAHENLPRDKNLLEYLEAETGLSREFVFNILKKYGFDPAEAQKPITELSPGGRARLLIAAFAARSVNVLILDEPTNHLDEDAIYALRGVLSSYKGTVVLVSHDRDFIEKTKLDYVYVLERGRLKQISNVSAYETQIIGDIKKTLAILKT